MTDKEIREAFSRPTITPKDFYKSKVLPVRLAGVYDAIRRGEIEVIEIGRKKAIITAPWRRKLGLEPADR